MKKQHISVRLLAPGSIGAGAESHDERHVAYENIPWMNPLPQVLVWHGRTFVPEWHPPLMGDEPVPYVETTPITLGDHAHNTELEDDDEPPAGDWLAWYEHDSKLPNYGED